MKKIILSVLVVLIGVFGLTACIITERQSLADYKIANIQVLQAYADAHDENNYNADGWQTVCMAVIDGEQAIKEASTKPQVVTAVTTAKENIDAVQTNANNIFPSVLEDFDLANFSAEFFEDNTLILVPFEWSYLLYKYLDFYTVFVENGKLNFLIEVTDPHNGGDRAIDSRLFAVVVSNEVLNGYEIGGLEIFIKYDFQDINGKWTPVPNSRGRLKEVAGKSVEHRVSYVTRGLSFGDFLPLKQGATAFTTITSIEVLKEYFYV